MFKDIYTLFDFFKYKNRNKIKRVFFFENNFIENHLAPYLYKNKNIHETLIISLYKTQNTSLKKFKIFQFEKLFFLNLFFLLLEIKYCYSSTPDLDYSAFQKSVFKKTKYIYIQHSPLGLSRIYRDNAFTNFDVVQVVNTFQKKDLNNISKIKRKKIKAWQGKYLFLSEKDNSDTKLNLHTKKKKILIAPTWGTDFYDLNIHLKIKNKLNPSKYDIFIRPHIMSILKNKNLNDHLVKNQFQISYGKINFTEFDLLITDWSGIYIEFAKINMIKSILIENKEKILNDNLYEFKNNSIDICARNILGEVIKLNNLSSIEYTIENILKNQYRYENEISIFFKTNFY